MSTKRSVLRCPDCGPSSRIERRPKYGFFKWLMLLGGGTPKPDFIEFYCESCYRSLAKATPTEPAKPETEAPKPE